MAPHTTSISVTDVVTFRAGSKLLAIKKSKVYTYTESCRSWGYSNVFEYKSAGKVYEITRQYLPLDN